MISILLVAAAGLGAFEYTDRFDYPDGSDGAPAWYTESVAWEVVNGVMTYPRGQRSFAILESAPYGKDLSLEAAVMVEQRAGNDWAVAGIALKLDDANYWHFALSEAPEAQGKRHFVELAEMLDGVWLSESNKDSRLSPTASEGGSFNWEYGVLYRLRMTLSPEAIRGELIEQDGARRAQMGYAFDNRAVKYGRPALTCAHFEARFDDVHVVVNETGPAPEVKPLSFPAYTLPGYASVGAPATGFFHPDKVAGRWWIIDPNGQAFYIVGTDHANYNAHWCQKLGYAPYSRNCEEKYGSEAKWADATIERLVQWNFNALAANHSTSLRYKKLPHIEVLSLGTAFSDYDDLCPKTIWTGFPNVFSPKWVRFCEKRAKALCAAHKDDPWLIGYFLDNELEWFGKSGKPWGLFEEAWKKPAAHSAKQAWINFLKHEVRTVDSLEQDWGIVVSDFDALARHVRPSAPLTAQGREIAGRWVRLCATEYFRKATDAIRKCDPNHMILGCRFAGDAPDVWDIAGDNCDVVSVNVYPGIYVDRGVPASTRSKIEHWYREADAPLMITEWSFPALDAGLPSLHGAGMRVDTQRQRAQCFQHFQTYLFSLPFMVGSDYFMWVDEPALGISDAFPEDGNYGLVNVRDEPYSDLTGTARALNARVYELHAEGKPPEPPSPRKLASWIGLMPATSVAIPAGELSLASGAFRLTGPSKGNAWTLSRGETPLGVFYPLFHQELAQSLWVKPNAAKITAVARDGRATVVDMTLSRTKGNDALTKVGEKVGAAEEQKDRPRCFESAWRFVIPHEGGWMACICQWVRNTDEKPWKLGEVFHYIIPAFGGDAVGDEPLLNSIPNYYRKGAAWVDSAADVGVGCWYADDEAFQCAYWKDPAGGLHSDLRQEINASLSPGEKVDVNGPPSFVFPMMKASMSAFSETVDTIERAVLVDK